MSMNVNDAIFYLIAILLSKDANITKRINMCIDILRKTLIIVTIMNLVWTSNIMKQIVFIY